MSLPTLLRLAGLLPSLLPVVAVTAAAAAPTERELGPGSEAAELPVLEVTVEGMRFVGPAVMPSGWIRLRLNNTSPMLHFAVLQRLPEGKTVDHHQSEVAPVFQNIMDSINGRALSRPAAGMELPEWFAEVRFLGGPGLVSAGHVAENIVHLEAGSYLLECYVKTGGVFHSFSPTPRTHGMVHPFEVREADSAAAAPEPTVTLTISRTQGISAPAVLPAGSHLIAVEFEDQETHENHLGHDVHLLRVQPDTDLERVATWINWNHPQGLETPAPGEFLGGTHEMPAGETAFFQVQLEPGEYAWIAEVPDASRKGMLRRFRVEAP